MSRDLIVLGPRRPDQAALRAALGTAADSLMMEGDLDAGAGVEISGVDGKPLLLAGPAELVPVEEIRETLGPVGGTAVDRWIGAPELWWFDIEVPAAGGPVGRSLAATLAGRLAEHTRGTVVDPTAADAR